MRDFLVKYCYKHYKEDIESMFLTDMYGMIPKDLKTPSIDFLVNGKDKLEKFFSVQAYEMQRRSIMDEKNAAKYQGILLHIKSLLVLLQRGKPIPMEFKEPEKVADPIDGVKDFLEKGRKLHEKK